MEEHCCQWVLTLKIILILHTDLWATLTFEWSSFFFTLRRSNTYTLFFLDLSSKISHNVRIRYWILFSTYKFFFLTNEHFHFVSFPLKNELSSPIIEQRAKLRDKLKVTNGITKSSFYLNSTVKISDRIRSSNPRIFYSWRSRSRNFSPILPAQSHRFYRTLAIYSRYISL